LPPERVPPAVAELGRSAFLALAAAQPIGHLCEKRMTRDQIQTAIKEGLPFMIRMADGATYKVREHYQVAVGRTSVVVFDDKDLAHILPLLTMTGITYLKPDPKR